MHMKSFFCICCFSFITIIALSQQVVNVDKDEYNAANLFLNVGGEPVVKAKFVRLVDGTPFFLDQWLKSTIITPMGRVYSNIPVKLDLMDGQLHYLDPKGMEFIATTSIKEVTLKDSLKNKNYRFISSFSLPMLKGGWYVPLVEGKVSLFKTFDKTLSENKPYGSAVSEQSILTKEKYILIYNKQPFYLKSDKELPSILTDQKEAIETFMKAQNKKQSLENRLIETVTYYNSLLVK